jgi:hypothetical protein
MLVCDLCNIEFKIVYICDRCGGRFCSKHKKPENHNCLTGNHRAPAYEPETQIIKEENVQITETPQEKYAHDSYLNKNADEQKLSTREKQDKIIPKYINSKLILISLLIVSVLANSYLFLQYKEYTQLSNDYIGLYDISKKVQGYYDNLTTQYSELRVEYTQLRSLYSNLLESKAGLEREYSDIINYRKEIQLVKEKTITIPPRQNYSEIYSIPFSGIIDVNYTATGETYTWVGSSGLESSYYSRNPQFPITASDFNFTLPVLPDFLLYFANPNEYEAIQITYWVKFTY